MNRIINQAVTLWKISFSLLFARCSMAKPRPFTAISLQELMWVTGSRFYLKNHWLMFLWLPGLVQVQSQMLKAFFLASPSSSAGGASASSPSAGLGFSTCCGLSRCMISSLLSASSPDQMLRYLMMPMFFSSQWKSLEMRSSLIWRQLQMMTSRQWPVLMRSPMVRKLWLWRLKKPKLWRMARFWQRRVLFSSIRQTRGCMRSISSNSASRICWLKSIWQRRDSGLLLANCSVQSAFLAMLSLIFAASSSPTSALTSASFFLLVLRISSFSSTLRLSTVGGPTTFTQFQTSLRSKLMPSMTSGELPLSATRVLKCAMIFRKGSSSPSSGAISFSLIEATYGSYSMCLQPNSLAMYLEAVVLPAQGAPVTKRYFLQVWSWVSKGMSRSICLRFIFYRKQMELLRLLLNWQCSGLTKSAKSLKWRVWPSNSQNSSGFQGKSVKRISRLLRFLKTTLQSTSIFSGSGLPLLGFLLRMGWMSKMLSSRPSVCSTYFLTISLSSGSCTLAQMSSGSSFLPIWPMMELMCCCPEMEWKQAFLRRAGTMVASRSKQSWLPASSVLSCLRWTILRWKQVSRMVTSAGSGVKSTRMQFSCLAYLLMRSLAVTGVWMSWQPMQQKQFLQSASSTTWLGPQRTISSGQSSFLKAAQLTSPTNFALPIISYSRFTVFSSAEYSPLTKITVSSAFHFSTARNSSTLPSTMSPFFSCSCRVVSEGLTRCWRRCSRAYWEASEDFYLGPKMKYQMGQ